MEHQELLIQIADMLERQTKEIKLDIETMVTKRIDSLFDGYNLTHEKQYELERQNEKLIQLLHDLQNRVAVLENRIA